MYKVQQWSGRLFKGSQEIPQDDRDPAYQEYVEFLRSKGTVEVEDDREAWEAAQASEPVEVLEDAAAWGAKIVRGFEAAAIRAGLNDVRGASLALDRYLREVSTALSAGRLHVAYDALAELLATPERERPQGAADAALIPIYNALAERLSLDPWRSK